jgi:hypothetical protein
VTATEKELPTSNECANSVRQYMQQKTTDEYSSNDSTISQRYSHCSANTGSGQWSHTFTSVKKDKFSPHIK